MEQVKERKLYRYEGAVLIFDRVVAHNFTAETKAVSEAKAKNNIRWQFREAANVAAQIPVTLTGKLRELPNN